MSIISQDEWNFWYNKVYGYFFRRIGSRLDVEELTSETLNIFFLKQVEVSSAQAFIWKIANNLLLAHIKKSYQKKSISVDNIEDFDFGSYEYSAEYKERLAKLQECVQRQLNSVDQEIVELAIMSDFSSQKIAEELNITPNNVRQRLHRAIKKLREKCRQIWM